jgi:hypothetical protein
VVRQRCTKSRIFDPYEVCAVCAPFGGERWRKRETAHRGCGEEMAEWREKRRVGGGAGCLWEEIKAAE